MNVPGPRVASLVCLALWLGAGSFFSFVVAPAAFRNLPREEAGKLVGAVFPWYYALGLGLALVAFWMALVERKSGVAVGRADLRFAAHAALVLLQLAGIVMLVWARALKAAMVTGPDLAARFSLVHGGSMLLNLLALGSALAALLL